MWDLEPDRYESVLGIDDSDVGLAGLGQRLIDGKPISASSQAVLLDSDYASKNNVKVGDSVKVGVDAFPVAGIVDAARSGKLVRADVYMPLALAQSLATAAPQVRALYPFGADDANLVLVKVNREQLQGVVEKVTGLIGKKGVVSSELSMRNALSGVLFLSQSMGLIIAAIIGLFAAAFVWRATATSVAERRREMAILQAIGWSWRHIGEQVMIENLALAVIGTAAGLAVALVVVLSLGHISVTVDLPWDLSSTPHFIPTADDQPHPDHYRADLDLVADRRHRHCRQPGDQPVGGSRRSCPAAAAALVAAARRMMEPRMSDTAMLAKSTPAPGVASGQEIIRVAAGQKTLRRRRGSQRRRSRRRRRTIHRHHGQVGLRQEHAARHHRRAGKAGRRRRVHSRPQPRRHERPRSWRPCAAARSASCSRASA